MNKKLAIILIVAGFVIGMMVSGGAVGYFFVRHYAGQQKILDYQFECQPGVSLSLVSLHTLEKFRANETTNTNAVEYLELQLDYAVAGIGRYLGHHPLSERDPDFPAIMPALRSAMRYRDQFPRTNKDVVLQKEIELALSVVNEKVKP